ncbi:uncharacterized protein VNE69_02121 [Vairimorpha necatrix]|uniref:Uncharacterized protein n=1 Tax=Vairimorpha necatrix TaxID=6039 RepID=A0AAX4J9H9_9MICR
MFIFIVFFKCSANFFNTGETSTQLQFDNQKKNNEDIFIKFLTKENNKAPQEERVDPTIEVLFEHLIKGGNLETYKGLTTNDNCQQIDNVNSNSTANDIEDYLFLNHQLNEMKDKFNNIKLKLAELFPKKTKRVIVVKFNKDEKNKIKFNRRYLCKRFLKYKIKMYNFAIKIKDELSKLNYFDMNIVFDCLDFIIEISDFVIPKINKLYLRKFSHSLLDSLSLDCWKIEEVINVIDIPRFISCIYIILDFKIKNKNKKIISILNDMVELKDNFSFFYKQKIMPVSRINEICEIIREKHNIIKQMYMYKVYISIYFVYICLNRF